MRRRRLLYIVTLSGAFVAPGLTPLHGMSPPAPEPFDEVLSVTVIRPPEHPGAFLIVAKGRTRLAGQPADMVLRQVGLHSSDPKVMRLWLGASPPREETPREPRVYDIQGIWLHLYPKPQLETVIVEGKTGRIATPVPR